MCGRVTITVTREDLKSYLYDYYSITNFNIDEYEPRYNVAPSQNVLAIINDGINNRAGFLKWGFIPEYSKDDKTIMINTRSETIDTLPTFKNSFINKRCIIPVDSYYEWKKDKNGKTPIRIMMKDNSIFALAGIWSTYIKEDNSKLFTFSILTTSANKLMSEIHERMPVILNKDNINNWLNPKNKDPQNLKSILMPFDDKFMTAYAVGNEVNSPKNDYANLIKRIK